MMRKKAKMRKIRNLKKRKLGEGEEGLNRINALLVLANEDSERGIIELL